MKLPEEYRESVAALFWSQVEKTDSCWLWIGHRAKTGYGVFDITRRRTRFRWRAHRLSWLLTNDRDPVLVLDHLCRVKHCVNPAHLEDVTDKINVLRGEGLCAANARKTHCKYGHPLSGPNMYVMTMGRKRERRCKACDSKRRKRRYERERAALMAARQGKL